MSDFENIKKMGFHAIKTRDCFENNRMMKREDYLKCPRWMEPEYDEFGGYEETPDGLYALFDPFTQQAFYKEGRVAIGAMVQANELLFERGKDNCPAAYLYSCDSFYMEHPEELRNLTWAIGKTKGEQGYMPSIQQIADILADEMERVFGYKLPRDVTEGRDVRLTTVFVERNHLPKKRLVNRMAPLLVLEDRQPDAIILPKWYWKD